MKHGEAPDAGFLVRDAGGTERLPKLLDASPEEIGRSALRPDPVRIQRKLAGGPRVVSPKGRGDEKPLPGVEGEPVAQPVFRRVHASQPAGPEEFEKPPDLSLFAWEALELALSQAPVAEQVGSEEEREGTHGHEAPPRDQRDPAGQKDRQGRIERQQVARVPEGRRETAEKDHDENRGQEEGEEDGPRMPPAHHA